MRIHIDVFGIAIDFHMGAQQDQPESVTREQAIANMDNTAAQIEFGFVQQEPWRYPEERWIES